ncbi:M23 family metallopeptidase [Amphibacillus sp. MSJ-3]|uniref:M23 family metallopeptidase n=1 Tax=Amphibacillus sp. MSJ-3 TaxID=2841505 RepID=UPI001C0E913B|nr:M23 family metallopeptidase [Amphibacillus sp. MSJ-3]MBU5594468.1 M23 family metallopeptidase [Amphibacillus sp. MSJ-3]
MQGMKKLNINIIQASILLFMLVLINSLMTSEIQVVYAKGDDDAGFSTIYHVYLDDEYLGAVKDQSLVEQHIADRIEAKNRADDTYTYGNDQELLLIPERVFSENVNIDQVLDRLDQELVIDVQATTLKFGDKTLGHFASKKDAEKAIFKYKSLYVDKEDLENLSDSKVKDAEPEMGESIVLDVELSEEASFSKSIVPEDDLLSVKEAMKKLEKGTLEELTHEVKQGDSLYSIALEYDLTEDKLLEINEDLEVDDLLQIGQELNVTDYVPFVDVIVYEEELKKEKIKFEKKVEKSDKLYRGETKKKQKGRNGKTKVHLGIKKVNGKTVEEEVLDEEVLKEVQDEIIIEGTKVISSKGTGDFAWPAVDGIISSNYGPRWGSRHKGIDIARPSNRKILAADNGTVEAVSYNENGYGNYIIINHNNGYKTLYGHLSSTSVSVGQTVPQGTKIGVMGTTGRSTGIHLHFEVIKNGANIDPLDVLN